MPGPHDDLIGVLQPGQFGWIILDAAGMPTGPATLEPPAQGTDVFATRVYAAIVTNPEQDLLVTPSGAPLSDSMNSNIDIRVNPVYTP